MASKSQNDAGLPLSASDVQALLKEPSADNRASTVEKIAQSIDSDAISEKELGIAQDILRILAKDAEVKVRAALSREAKSASRLPHDVAVSLAGDVAEVSSPILEYSSLLTDEDLILIVQESQEMDKLKAVANRSTVSTELSDALIDHGSKDVVATLVDNAGADISEGGLHKVVDKYGEDEDIQGPLVGRDSLPISLTERLVSVVSDRLREQLVVKHELPTEVAADLLMQSRERVTLGLVESDSSTDRVEELVAQLARNGRLTESIILRAACLGDLTFVEAAVSRLSGVPMVNTQILFDDSGDLGLQALFERTKLPKRSYVVLRKAVDVMREIELDGEPHDRERFSRRVLERVLTAFENENFGLSEQDIDYLMAKLSALTDAEHAA